MGQYNLKQLAPFKSTRQTVTSGAATTLANAEGPIDFFINPAATLAAHAVTAPPAPVDGQLVRIYCGGTMITGVVVTNLTFVANTGQGLLEPAAPGSSSAGKSVAYRYDLTLAKWFRLY